MRMYPCKHTPLSLKQLSKTLNYTSHYFPNNMLMHLLPTTCHFQQKHNSVFVPQKQEDNGQKYIGPAAKQQCANTTSTFTGTWPTTQWRTATQSTSKTQTRAKRSRQTTKKRCIQMNALSFFFCYYKEKKKRKQHYFDFVIHDIL